MRMCVFVLFNFAQWHPSWIWSTHVIFLKSRLLKMCQKTNSFYTKFIGSTKPKICLNMLGQQVYNITIKLYRYTLFFPSIFPFQFLIFSAQHVKSVHDLCCFDVTSLGVSRQSSLSLRDLPPLPQLPLPFCKLFQKMCFFSKIGYF